MTVFHTNSTIPFPGSNFVTSPNIRGTLSIAWTCISALTICSWSILHLNVPLQAKPTRTSQWVRYKLHVLGTKLMWMSVMLVVPEWMVGKALVDRFSASFTKEAMAGYSRQDGVEWSLTHSFYANMGGFVISFLDVSEASKEVTRIGLRRQQSVPPHEFEPERQNDENGRTADVSVEECMDAEMDITDANLYTLSDCELDQNFVNPEQPEAAAHNLSGVQRQRASSQSSYESSVHEYFSQELNKKSSGPNGLLPQIDKMSRGLGKIHWIKSDINQELVSAAIQHARYKDFGLRYKEWLDSAINLQGDIWILDAAQLVYTRAIGVIPKLPLVSEDEINDHSKADVFVKTIAIAQLGWLVLSMIVRQVNHLPSSQLEIVTLAFAVESLAIWVLLLAQPQDVSTCRIVSAVRYPTVKEISALSQLGPHNSNGSIRRRPWMPNHVFHYCGAGVSRPKRFRRGAVVAGVTFGALHCLSWNSVFPTICERVIWRVCAVYTVVAPMALTSIIELCGRQAVAGIKQSAKDQSMPVFMKALAIITLLYVFARIYIMVETVRAVFYLPPETYFASWTRYLPHIG